MPARARSVWRRQRHQRADALCHACKCSRTRRLLACQQGHSGTRMRCRPVTACRFVPCTVLRVCTEHARHAFAHAGQVHAPQQERAGAACAPASAIEVQSTMSSRISAPSAVSSLSSRRPPASCSALPSAPLCAVLLASLSAFSHGASSAHVPPHSGLRARQHAPSARSCGRMCTSGGASLISLGFTASRAVPCRARLRSCDARAKPAVQCALHCAPCAAEYSRAQAKCAAHCDAQRATCPAHDPRSAGAAVALHACHSAQTPALLWRGQNRPRVARTMSASNVAHQRGSRRLHPSALQRSRATPPPRTPPRPARPRWHRPRPDMRPCLG